VAGHVRARQQNLTKALHDPPSIVIRALERLNQY